MSKRHAEVPVAKHFPVGTVPEADMTFAKADVPHVGYLIGDLRGRTRACAPGFGAFGRGWWNRTDQNAPSNPGEYAVRGLARCLL